MFSSAEKFGCAVGDTICVCEKAPDFENGIKDCVVQACIGPLGESQDQITHAQDHGADVCNGKISFSVSCLAQSNSS